VRVLAKLCQKLAKVDVPGQEDLKLATLTTEALRRCHALGSAKVAMGQGNFMPTPALRKSSIERDLTYMGVVPFDRPCSFRETRS
jgi:hypothetical protein